MTEISSSHVHDQYMLIRQIEAQILCKYWQQLLFSYTLNKNQLVGKEHVSLCRVKKSLHELL